MRYKIVKTYKTLEPYIHFYWELKGNKVSKQWERVFPDGCAGVLINLGNRCLTDNGLVSMENRKTYVVGAMNSFKDSLIDSLRAMGKDPTPNQVVTLIINELESANLP